MSDEAVDPRPGPSPSGLFLEIGTIGLGLILLLFQPGTGDFVLDWPRLLARTAPAFVCLLAVERALSRRIRARTVGTYPTTPAVVLVLLGVSLTLVSVANRVRPSADRVVRTHVLGFFPRIRAGADLLPAPPVQESYEGLNEWIVTVDSWQKPNAVVHVSIPPEDQRAASVRPPHEVDVHIVRGLLGLEYVTGARIARDP